MSFSINRRVHLAASVTLTLFLLGQGVSAQTSLQRVTSGLSNGLYLTHIPGDTSRAFMLEQSSGRIRSLDSNTGSVATYMTVPGLATGGERGLLGLAFDPNYETNGHFYTYSSHPSGLSGNHRSEVRRYTVNGDPATSNSADPASAQLVMTFVQPFSNHNGGWIGFDPTADNSNLYIAAGDGGSGGDPGDRVQDITNQPLGKMLRIDVSGDDFPTDPNKNYKIPSSNPFVGQTGDDEIWAYGLRNSWRNSFDRKTGDFWIADVGQNAREEINFQPADSPGGENYGWRVMEGTACFNNNSVGPPCFDDSFTDPVYDYLHNGGNFGGFSVTGGYVHRGSIAQYEGLYFFGDYVTENIWTVDPYANDIAASVVRRNTELPTSVGSVSGLTSFGEDANGEMYVVSGNGNVYRMQTTSQDAVWDWKRPVRHTGRRFFLE